MAVVDIQWMQGGASKLANYFTNEPAGYFTSQSLEATWRGKYAAELGFVGKVTTEQLKAALNNRSAYGNRVTQRDSKERRSCLHIVVSEPKGISLMAMIAGDQRIITAHRRAVDIMMQRMAEMDASRRVRKGGKDTNKVTGNLVYSAFTETTTRPNLGKVRDHVLGLDNLDAPEPQLHTHIVVPNFTYDPSDGKWYALDGEHIKANAAYWNMFYNITMLDEMRKLGYQMDVDGGNYDIKGITKEMRDKFSSRRMDILDECEERNITNPLTRNIVSAMTRGGKDSKYTEGQLQQIWASRLTQSELSQIRDIYVSALGYGVRDTPDFSAKYIEKALGELTHKDTWITERKLLTAAMREGLGKVSMEGMESHIHDLTRRGQIIRKKNKLTSDKAYAKFWHVIDMWKAGMGKHEKLGRDTYTVKDPPHIKALKKLMGSRDTFMSVRANIKRNDAIKSAQGSLNAAPLKDINNPPQEEVWFITSKVPDGDLPDIMEKAIELDKRVVFWGELQRSDLEEQLRLKPIELFDRPEPKTTLSKRLEQFILTMIQRGRDVFEERREPERHTRTEQPTPDRGR